MLNTLKVGEDEIPKYLGRGSFPKFIEVPAVSPTRLHERYADPNVGFWACLAAKLRELAALLQSPIPGNQTYALMDYCQRQLGKVDAHLPGAMNGAYDFDVFKHPLMGMERRTVSDLAQCADYVQDKLFKTKKAEGRRKFKDFIMEDLLKGGGRLHKFANKPNSAIPIPSAMYVEGEYLSQPRDMLAHFRQKWANIWGDAPPDSIRPWADGQGNFKGGADWFPEFDDFIKSLKGYGRRARAVDHWSMGEWAGLPEPVLWPLYSLMLDVKELRTWPWQIFLILVALLGKPGGGDRGIGLTPMLARAFDRAISYDIKDWQAAIKPDYDSAGKGSSTFNAAMERSLKDEIAQAYGLEILHACLDIHNFFDTMDPDILAERAGMMGYPGAAFELAMQLNQAPRVLRLRDAYSEPVVPIRSTVQGCLHSMPLAKVYLQPAVAECLVGKEKLPVEAGVHVDDVTITSRSVKGDTLPHILEAVTTFERAIKKAKLTLSEKSTVVASDHDLTRRCVRMLRDDGIVMKVAKEEKVLGVDVAAAKYRTYTTRSNRAKRGLKRNRTVGYLAGRHRFARKLFKTGTMPQTTWGGEATGFSRTAVRNIRRMAGYASGINQTGRCLTTAIALAYGQYEDPAITIFRKQVATYCELFQRHVVEDKLLVKAWQQIQARLWKKGKPSWGGVRGIISATILTLWDNGWKPARADIWVDPEGHSWTLTREQDVADLLKYIRETTRMVLWRKASTHLHGKGMEDGLDWSTTTAYLGHLAKNHMSREHAMLETIMASGCWPEARRHECSLVPTSKCNRCGVENADMCHCLWQCKANEEISDPAVKSTQNLRRRAEEGCKEHPCFWLRGIVPAAWANVASPYPLEEEWEFDGAHRWDREIYWSDASGGVYSSYPTLRRCGVGIAYVDNDGEYVGGEFGVLPGKRHTAPRAELFAIYVIIRDHDDSGNVLIVSDSLINVDIFNLGPAAYNSQRANSDLWSRIWRRCSERKHRASVKWTKGHVDDEETYLRYQPDLRDMLGNEAADNLAKKGATMREAYVKDAANVKATRLLALRVQRRAVAILMSLPEVEIIERDKPPKLPRISTHAQLMTAEHDCILERSKWVCRLCNESTVDRPVAVQAFAKTRCIPLPEAVWLPSKIVQPVRLYGFGREYGIKIGHRYVHSSHRMGSFMGLFYCRTCGAIGDLKIEKLAKHCDVRTPAGKRNLTCIKGHLKPPSVRNREWPILRRDKSRVFIK